MILTIDDKMGLGFILVVLYQCICTAISLWFINRKINKLAGKSLVESEE